MFSNFLPIQFLTQYSINIFSLFIQKYTIYKNIFFNLFLCLSGLPPVGLFFIKFNLLAYILNQTHIFVIFILYIVFLANMFFYLQLFNFKNTKVSIFKLLNTTIFNSWSINTFCCITNHTYLTFSYVYWIIFFLFFLFFFIFFFNDLFLILQMYFIN